jgi:hypothetical protein
MLIKVLEEMVPDDLPRMLRTHTTALPRLVHSLSATPKVLTPAMRMAINEHVPFFGTLATAPARMPSGAH